MVRIRKNANTLKPPEKARFVAAFAQLNNQGLGRFTDFRDMHRTTLALNQAHGAPGFLPWHRAYLLDLERELQAIDASVALPYWRFDQPAPNIFKPDFLGVSDNLGTVSFANNNPLQFWKTDGQPGINRRPLFNINVAPPGLRTEAQTLALGANCLAVPHHGRQSARIGTCQLRRHDPERVDRPERPAVLPAPLQRRPAVGEVAAPERPLQSGGRRLVQQQQCKPDRAQAGRTPCGHGTA